MRQVILYIAISLDGYIARENGDLDWLSLVESPGEDYGYEAHLKTIDTVIMGRKTYEKVLSFGIPFPHKDRKCYVISNSKTGSDENVEFYNQPIEKLIAELKAQEGKNIFIDGGAQLVNDMIKKDLIDLYTVSVIPTLLGQGISLWQGKYSQLNLSLLSSTSFPSGLVQLCYERKIRSN